MSYPDELPHRWHIGDGHIWLTWAEVDWLLDQPGMPKLIWIDP